MTAEAPVPARQSRPVRVPMLKMSSVLQAQQRETPRVIEEQPEPEDTNRRLATQGSDAASADEFVRSYSARRHEYKM